MKDIKIFIRRKNKNTNKFFILLAFFSLIYINTYSFNFLRAYHFESFSEYEVTKTNFG